MTRTRLRGKCPVCHREVALADDRSLFAHNGRRVYRRGFTPEPCRGSGQQPLDQFRIPFELAKP